jgi:hypothetical protein
LTLPGGSQGGAIRYAAVVESDEAYYFCCRMCQKTFGGLFGVSGESLGSEEIHLTVGSLDEPGRLRPVAHYGFEAHVGSFFTNDGLPRSRTEDSEEFVARWKAAHGEDSVPGPLPGPAT